MNLLECSKGLICFLRWSPTGEGPTLNPMVELDRGSFPASFAPMLPLVLAFLPLDVFKLVPQRLFREATPAQISNRSTVVVVVIAVGDVLPHNHGDWTTGFAPS